MLIWREIIISPDMRWEKVKMIVFYTQPNTLSLPYKTIKKIELKDDKGQLVYDAKGNIKLINKIEAAYVRFVPGKNTITNELWVKIVEYNKKNWDYYSTILNVFKGSQQKSL